MERDEEQEARGDLPEHHGVAARELLEEPREAAAEEDVAGADEGVSGREDDGAAVVVAEVHDDALGALHGGRQEAYQRRHTEGTKQRNVTLWSSVCLLPQHHHQGHKPKNTTLTLGRIPPDDLAPLHAELILIRDLR